MTTPRRFLSALSLAAALWLAPPAVRAADTDETAGPRRLILRKYCQQCHAGPADRIKGDLSVLDLAALHRRKVVRDGKPAESELFQLVECGSMPPGALPKPGPAEVDVLREWIGDAPADFPPEYGDSYVMKQIEKDLAAVNARNPKDVETPARRQLQPPARRGRRPRAGPVAGGPAQGAQPPELGAEPGRR